VALEEAAPPVGSVLLALTLARAHGAAIHALRDRPHNLDVALVIADLTGVTFL
jgi:hypothetical protein